MRSEREKHMAATVAELAGLATRQAQALTEGGHPELAARTHMIVLQDGTVLLSSNELARIGSPTGARLKALQLDPLFAETTPPGTAA